MATMGFFVFLAWTVVFSVAAQNGLKADVKSRAKSTEQVSMELVEQVLGPVEEKIPLADANMRPHKLAYKKLMVPKKRSSLSNAPEIKKLSKASATPTAKKAARKG